MRLLNTNLSFAQEFDVFQTQSTSFEHKCYTLWEQITAKPAQLEFYSFCFPCSAPNPSSSYTVSREGTEIPVIIASLTNSLSIERERISALGTGLSPIPSVVCLSVWKVYRGKTADWIRVPFGW